ncbi:hypothetical protein [Paucilactobacillus nenjiangensis]|uniref:hypothetical protein n=1 Tax=Paucilactobacillus nenjiangensis TaxID=1296540 RepID=UPI003BB5EAEB
MQIFMHGSVSIWQYGLLVIFEKNKEQEHFVCKTEFEADDLFDEFVFKVYN